MSEISETVFQQYEVIRQSGKTNMFDLTNVRNIATQLEFQELLDFINTKQYPTLIRNYDELRSTYGGN